MAATGQVRALVSGIAGPICEVKVDRTNTGWQVKEAIQEATQGLYEACMQRLVIGNKQLGSQTPLHELLEEGVEEVSVLLVRTGRYDGLYEVQIELNGPVRLTISADTVWHSENSFPIKWYATDHRKCEFTIQRAITTYWSTHHTEGKHTAEEGVKENFKLTFASDDPRDGFTGRFQRSYEGSLAIEGSTFLGEGAS